jgi:hypothetical protein
MMFNPDGPMMRRMVYLTALLRASSPLAYPFDRFCRDLPSDSWEDGANYNCFKRLTVKCW